MQNELVKISKKDLYDLVLDSLKLNCLVNGGVDNWECYDYALNENSFGDESYNDLEDLGMDEFFDSYCSCYVK